MLDPIRNIGFLMGQRAATLIKRQDGVAFIEFAVCISMLLIMFYGAIELSRYILIVQKVEKTTYTMPDVVTQSEPGSLHDGDVTQFLNSVPNLMNPYPMGSAGNVIISDITTPAIGTTPTIQWQVCGGGTLAVQSKLGQPGGTANLSVIPGFSMNAQEEVVIGEMFYNFTPILNQSIVTGAQIYRTALFRPRYGNGALGMQTNVPCL
jgi:Flp pilus assembly protein TadG